MVSTLDVDVRAESLASLLKVAWHESSRSGNTNTPGGYTETIAALSDIKNCSQELERREETNSQSMFDLHWLQFSLISSMLVA